MKSKKGFTLIELLAIIVILAIIAIITVPIILNIVEKANVGAVKNSAYGYKDAISKFYVSKLVEDSDYDIPDGVYSISDLDTLGVIYDGKGPDGNSWLTIKNNNVLKGCLQFDEYSVVITGGSVGNAVKGECQPSYIKALVYTATFDANTGERTLSTSPKTISDPSIDLNVGDYVVIGEDGFYVINPDKDGNVLLLCEYNITNVASENQEPKWEQTSGDDYDVLKFSNTRYFSSYASGDYVYTTEKDENEEYLCNLVEPIENYKSSIGSLIGPGRIETAEVMTYGEAQELISNSWIYNQSYWLGNMFSTNYGGIIYGIRYVDTTANLYVDYNAWYDGTKGVRPVIEVAPSVFLEGD